MIDNDIDDEWLEEAEALKAERAVDHPDVGADEQRAIEERLAARPDLDPVTGESLDYDHVTYKTNGASYTSYRPPVFFDPPSAAAKEPMRSPPGPAAKPVQRVSRPEPPEPELVRPTGPRQGGFSQVTGFPRRR